MQSEAPRLPGDFYAGITVFEPRARILVLTVLVLVLVRARQEAWVPGPVFRVVIPVAALIHGPVLAAFLRISLQLTRG